MFKILRVPLIRGVYELRKMPFYAVRVGREPGIYTTWSECKKQVDGVTARFKKFNTMKEAEQFMNVEDPKDLKRKPFQADTQVEEKTGQSSEKKTTKNKGSKRKKDENQEEESKKFKAETSDSDRPVVYTDGCCFFNGRNNAKAGIGVFWGDGDARNLSEQLKGTPTNQRAELNAAIRALETAIAAKLYKIEIRTDSKYTINAMTSWMSSWKKKGFKTAKGEDVKNKEDMVKLDELCQELDVKWVHVQGHSDVYGNEKADELAKQGTKL